MSTQDTNAMSWLSQFGQIYRSIDVSPSTSVSNIGQVGGNNKIIQSLVKLVYQLQLGLIVISYIIENF